MSRHNKNFISLILASVFLYGCSTFSFYNVPVVQGNIFNEETFHIRQQISPVTTRDNSNNLISSNDENITNV